MIHFFYLFPFLIDFYSTVFLLPLILHHYCKLNLLSTRATKSSWTSQAAKPSDPGFCHIENIHSSQCCKNKQENPATDKAKIQIKSEKPTPLGGIFSDYGAILYTNQKYTCQMRLFQIKVLYLPSKDGVLLSGLSKTTQRTE